MEHDYAMRKMIAKILCVAALLCSLAWSEEKAFIPPQVSRCNIKIVTAKVLNQFKGKYLPMDLDVGFVLTVEFLDDCKVLDKKAGDKAHLGFNSVLKTFGEEFGDVTGRIYSVDITRMFIREKLRFNVRRVLSQRLVTQGKPVQYNLHLASHGA